MTRLSPQQKALRSISERDWARTVCDILTAHRFAYYVAPIPGRRADGSLRQTVPGWPDIAAVRGERLLFLELKAELGRVSSEQRGWLDDLSAVQGVECHVLRPSDRELLLALMRAPVNPTHPNQGET